MPSTRPTRQSSRTSSPFVRSQNESPAPAPVKEQRLEKGQGTLSAWFEPAPKAPAPSFTEHGFDRIGVLTNMQALGEKPSAKLKAKLREDAHRGAYLRRSDVMQSVEDARDTPEGTPFTERETSIAQKPDEPLPARPVSKKGEEDDQDYVPNGVKSSSRSARNSVSKAGEPTVAPTPEAPTPRTPTSKPNPRREKLRSIVENAAQHSQSVGRPTVGCALSQLYNESLNNQDLTNLLFAVLEHRNTTQQQAAFHDYIKSMKKKCKHRHSDNDHCRPSPLSVPAALPAKSPHAVSAHNSFNNTALPAPPARTSGFTLKLNGPRLQPGQTLSSVSPQKSLPVRTPDSDRNRTRSKRPKVTSPTPAESIQVDVMASGKPAAAPARSKSVESTSSLSEVDEAILQSASPSVLNTNGVNTARASRSRDGSQTIHELAKATKGHKHSKSLVTQQENEEEAQALDARKQSLKQTFDDYKVSDSDIRDRPAPAAVANADKPSRRGTQSLRLVNGTATHTGAEDSEILTPSSLNTPDLSTAATSRPETPVEGRATKRRRIEKERKDKIAARTKTSPIKKRAAVVAGISRAGGGGMDSPLGYEHDEVSSENEDFCFACAGSGFLVCCDECDKAFHFTCFDPPLDQDSELLENAFLCKACKKDEYKPAKETRLFGPLHEILNNRNPTAFRLPPDVKFFFEDVREGPEGEYDEINVQRTTRNRNTGWTEAPEDHAKLKDGKGSTILCCQCSKSSLDHRKIITCDVCGANWHLDCLDPPMANPPPQPLDPKKKNLWKCPRHIDHDLRKLVSRHANDIAGARPHRVRRAKNAKVITPALSRGIKNSGLIEIESESSSDESEFYEEDNGTEVFKLPERGIKLDFIHKIKRSRLNAPYVKSLPSTRASSKPNAQQTKRDSGFSSRSFAEQKTALNLAQLAHKEPDLSLDGDRVQQLTFALMAEAPEMVQAAITRDEATQAQKPRNSSRPSSTAPAVKGTQPLDAEERQQLLALQKLIQRRLKANSAIS